jgi:C4-dicarboxylate-specific signal transduction histidine kinase
MFDQQQQLRNAVHQHHLDQESADAYAEHPAPPTQPVNPSSETSHSATASIQHDFDGHSCVENLTKVLSFVCISDIIAGVVHEINNPLQVIMGRTQIARLGKNIEDSLQIIEKQTMRIANIVRNLNAFVHHPNSGVETYSPKEVLEGVLELIASQFNKRNIQISVKFEATPTISGQRSVFRQILMSSLLNAKKRIGYNGQLFIRIKSPQKNQFVLEICDTAPMISNHTIDLLSQPLMVALSSPEAAEHIELIALFQTIRQQGGKAVFKESAVGNLLEISLPMQGNTDVETNTKPAPQTEDGDF